MQAATNPCSPTPSSLVAWWRADNNALDSSGTNHGVLQNGASFAAGQVGQAFNLDGVDDSVDIGMLPQLGGATGITVMAWVRKTENIKWAPGFVGQYNSDFDSTFLLYNGEDVFDGRPHSRNKGRFYVFFDDRDLAAVHGSNTIPVGEWTFIAGTWRSADGHLALYKNGILEAASTNGVGKRLQTAHGYAGKIGNWGRPLSQSHQFQGQIDEVAIFNRALTSNEIAAIHAAGSAGMCSSMPPCAMPPSGLAGWWRGENNAADSTGNAHGVLSNGVTFALGRVGQGFRLDGVNGAVVIGDAPSLRFSTELTIAAWIFPTGSGADAIEGGILVNKEGEYEVTRWPDGTIRWAFANQNPGWAWISSGGYAPLNQWTHIVVTYAAGLIITYLNGQMIDSYAGGGLIGDASSDLNELRIGNRQAGNSTFDGILDEVSVFERALNATEIAAIYSAGESGMCPLSAPVIVVQPFSRTNKPGSATTFTVAASGSEPLRYQWLFNGTNLTSGQVAFREDFESYVPGSDLIGQRGWSQSSAFPASQMLVNGGMNLPTQVVDGKSDAVPRQLNGAIHAVTGEPSRVTRLRFTTHATTAPVRTHNSGVTFGSSTNGTGTRAGWEAASYTGSSPSKPRWRFSATPNHAFDVPGGFDIPAHFELVADGPANEVYGTYDFGSGPVETPRFPMTPTEIASLQLVQIHFDQRNTGLGSGGMELDHLIVTTLSAGQYFDPRLAGAQSNGLTIANLQPRDAGSYQVVVRNDYGSVTSAVATLTVDGRAPVWSALSVTPGVTTATISYQTDEPAISVLQYFLNSGPVRYLTNANLAAFVTNHVHLITGLLPEQSYVGTLYRADAAGNQSQSGVIYFRTLAAPDLRVAGLAVDGPAVSGGTLTIRWEDVNDGRGNASGFWYDRLTVVNTNLGLTLADVTLPVDTTANPLTPGGTIPRSHAVALPVGSNGAGGLLITARADVFNALAEYDYVTESETNNAATLSVSSSLTPLPDLAINSVSAPAAATPGQPFVVVHVVTNGGAAIARAPWVDYLHAAADGASSGTFLGGVTVSNDLPPGASLSVTQAVVLPVDGDAGSLLFTVSADGNRTVAEFDEDNNVAVSAASTAVPLVLTLSPATVEVAENGAPFSMTVRRNGSRAAPLTASLASSDASELSVPASVMIAAGQSAGNFLATAQPDASFDGPQTVSLTAAAHGYAGAGASVTVLDVDLPALAFAPAAPLLTEGQGVLMTVIRQVTTDTPLTVILQPDTIALAAPATVTIPANTNAANFPLTALNNTGFEPTNFFSVRATAPGHRAATLPVTVLDDDTPNLTLHLASPSVSENAGPNAVSATLTRDRPSPRQLIAALSSSNTNAIRVPAFVTIPGGATNASFNVAAVNNAEVDGPRQVTIRAWVVQSGGSQLLREGPPATLEVTDDDGPALFITLAREVAGEGAAVSGTARRNTGTNGPLTVVLASDDASEATVPAEVIIPNGTDSTAFTIATVSDGTPDGNQSVTISASAPGYTSGSRTLTVSDADLPDLTITSFVAPTNALTAQTRFVALRVENHGVAAAGTGFTQRLFLSGDPVIGGDTLVAQAEFSGGLPVGQFFEQTFPVRLPSSPGNYWLIASTDVNNVVPELLENNNTRVASHPVVVEKAYSVTVGAEVHQAPAGTAIPLRGRATRVSDGAAAAFELVNIHVVLRGTRRIFSVVTDASGGFSVAFNPLPGEAGNYTVAADHPGVSDPPAQDQFVLFGLRVGSPAPLTLAEGESASGTVMAENLSDVPLSGLSATVVSGPASPALSLGLATNALSGNGQVTLAYTVSAPLGLSGQGSYRVRVATVEGVSGEFTLPVTVERLRPRLVASPSSLTAGMKRGTQSSTTFGVTNLGGATAGSLSVLLPNFSWLTLATPPVLPALAPGEGAEVTLLLTPPADLPLGPYTGSLALNSTNAGLPVGFSFRCLSDAMGALRIVSVDEYTYYAEGAPKVTNATVRLTDAFSGAIVLETNTAPSGNLLLPDMAEGYYELRVEAPQHSVFRQVILVEASKTNEVTALMGRQSVRYVWTVTPVELEDRYTITVETIFETVVPKPVIVVEPTVIDLGDMVENERQVNVSISNHGLIAAINARLSAPTHPDFTFTPLITDIGLLPAQSTLTVPIVIRRVAAGGGFQAAAASTNKPCSVPARIEWDTPCGNLTFHDSIDLSFIRLLLCDGLGIGSEGNINPFAPKEPPVWEYFDFREQWPFGPGGFNVAGGIVFGGTTNFGCDPCVLKKLRALSRCVVRFIPLPDWYKCRRNRAACEAALQRGVPWYVNYPCLKAEMVCSRNPLASYLKYIECYGEYRNACFGLPGHPGQLTAASTPLASPDEVLLSNRVERVLSVLRSPIYLFGDAAWLEPEDESALEVWLAAYSDRIDTNEVGIAGASISATERAELLALPLPPPLTTNHAVELIERWNRSVDYWNVGILTQADVPAGQNTNFVDLAHFLSLTRAADNALEQSAADGFSDPLQGVEAAKVDIIEQLSSDSGGGICARVRLRLDQTAIISRDAFQATLEVDNDTDGPLGEVFFEVRMTRRGGGDTTALFQLRPPELTGITAIDGTGIIPAGGTARASVILVPTSLAAPTNATEHLVSGTLRYRQAGVEVTIPLSSLPIVVLPNPSLTVRYFHERDVFSDDPFTPEVEPAVPYSLAVLVENHGHGSARNMRINSAQPRIIENERGLLIDFEIIATEVANQPLQPSLTVNLGDIGPGQTALGRWLFKSSLQGLFTDYQATFEHIDGKGDRRLSLIDRVEIHEVNHLVRADRQFEDGRFDFLVNDVPDLDDLPDTLWFSSGSNAPVSAVTDAVPDAPASADDLLVQLTAPALPDGWVYLRLSDPGRGPLRLVAVRRSDGSTLPTENFWATDRTFTGFSQRPRRENVLHLLDFNSAAGSGSYTLIYEQSGSMLDTTPPASAVVALPSLSAPEFALMWNGADEPGGSGLAFFDVFVSANGGPFTNWLAHSSLGGAVFRGEPGVTYRFFTRATDSAGNPEPAPALPDAMTTVNLINNPPALAMAADVSVDEGETVRFTAIATDNDLPAQTLRFVLLVGAPPGAAVDPVTGAFHWVTGEGNGPSTNLVQLRVTDNGLPPQSATSRVNIVVREVNSSPVISVVTNRVINEGFRLVITNRAADFDLPAQTLTWSLQPGAPDGAVINPTNGEFLWRPGNLAGPSTNTIRVAVTDDGVPPLTATRSFTVFVRDSRPDFSLGLGRTNVLGGETSFVPVLLNAGLDLTLVQFGVSLDATRLGGLTLGEFAPEILSATLLPVGTNRSELQFALDGAGALAATRVLAQFGFVSAMDGLSGVVPLRVDELAGVSATGTVITNGAALEGEVIVVTDEPVLTTRQTRRGTMKLFGLPGRRYRIETSPNLGPDAVWELVEEFRLEGRAREFPLAGRETTRFYRVAEP
jgi:hypothetical protein